MRTKSLLLTAVLLITLIPTSVFAVTFQQTGYYMTYWGEDLTAPDGYGTMDTMASLDKTGAPLGCTSFLKAIDKESISIRRSNPFTADIYIPEDGTYYIWGCGWGQSGADRWMHFGFDYVMDESVKIGASKPETTGFVWSRTTGTALTKGWHKITGYGNRTSAWLAGIFVTDDATLTLDVTVTKAELDAYASDKTAPVLKGSIEHEITSNGGVILTLPTESSATDNSGKVVMTYKVNDAEVTPDANGKYEVEYLFPLMPLKVEVIAADWHGNKATLTKSIDVQGSDSNTYINLWPENFTLPTDKDPNYTIQSGQDINLNENKDAPRGTFLRDGGYQDNSPATAEIYISRDGEYYIWGCGGDMDNSGTRHAKIGFDKNYDSQEFGSSEAGFEWRRSEKSYTLTKGWHTVDTYAGYATSRVASIVITDDKNMDLSKSAPTEFLEACADLTAPTLSGQASIQSRTDTSMTIALPTADDNSGNAELQVFVNDEETTVTGGTVTVENLLPLGTVRLKAVAKDRHGNASAKYEKTFAASKIQASSFQITKTASGLQVTLEGTAETANQAMVIGLAIYSKDFSRMETAVTEPVIETGTAVRATAILPLPAAIAENLDDYVVQAVVWDSLYSGVPMIAGITKKGSEFAE